MTCRVTDPPPPVLAHKKYHSTLNHVYTLVFIDEFERTPKTKAPIRVGRIRECPIVAAENKILHADCSIITVKDDTRTHVVQTPWTHELREDTMRPQGMQ